MAVLGLNREQIKTLAALTRAEPDPEMAWDIEDTNIEGVLAIREFQTGPDRIATILIHRDGGAVALGDDGGVSVVTPPETERLGIAGQ